MASSTRGIPVLRPATVRTARIAHQPIAALVLSGCIAVVTMAGCQRAVAPGAGQGECAASVPLVSTPDTPALANRQQRNGWTLAPGIAADDAECAALQPRIPASLSFTLPADRRCQDLVVNPQSVLAVRTHGQKDAELSFSAMDGSRWRLPLDGTARWFTSGQRGFFLVHQPGTCEFTRELDSEGNTLRDVDGGLGEVLILNPSGGYVESNGETFDAVGRVLQVRWRGEDLSPSDPHVAFVQETPRTQSNQFLAVDRNGYALFLARFYPPSFAAPLPPSTWEFVARWMGPDGPRGPVFQPVVPKWIDTQAAEGWVFDRWGPMIPLTEGGLAAYQAPPSVAELQASPGPGWHTWYPEGESTPRPAPTWMAEHDHTLQALPEGAGYVAVRRDPATCARTVSLIAPSGRTCRTLALEAAEGCDAKESLWPDGTLVLQSNTPSCHVRWWPRVARAPQ